MTKHWTAYVENARVILIAARQDLGHDLAGFSVFDLLCDNLPISSEDIREIMKLLKEK